MIEKPDHSGEGQGKDQPTMLWRSIKQGASEGHMETGELQGFGL